MLKITIKLKKYAEITVYGYTQAAIAAVKRLRLFTPSRLRLDALSEVSDSGLQSHHGNAPAAFNSISLLSFFGIVLAFKINFIPYKKDVYCPYLTAVVLFSAEMLIEKFNKNLKIGRAHV